MSHSYLIVRKVNQAWSTLFDTQNAYHPIYTYIYIYFSARQLLIKFRHVKIRGPWRWTRDASLCSRSANVPWTGGGRIAPRKSNKITCLLTIGPFYVPRSLFAASYVVWHVVAGRGGGEWTIRVTVGSSDPRYRQRILHSRTSQQPDASSARLVLHTCVQHEPRNYVISCAAKA